ncbi:uncharacterized protein LOC119163117 isoform X5 [Rhipicephalus microplus]|uniref:uncharacterized protein LOC119163117 isoform X5 n=1 Tax=Rhipicephalus microplus TaxID=6941 RepID=UPI003F6B8634
MTMLWWHVDWYAGFVGFMELRSPCCEGFCTAVSLLLFASSIFVDLSLCGLYLHHHKYECFGMTLIIFVQSTIIVNLMSWIWHKRDEETSCCTKFWTIFQLGVLRRHFLILGLLAKKHVDNPTQHSLKRHTTDLRLLHLYEAFLKSGPQLVIQLYLRFDTHDWNLLTVSNWFLTLAIVVLMNQVGAIFRVQKWDDILHMMATLVAITFSFIDVGHSSFWPLIGFTYVHTWYQIRESIEEFIKEKMKHGADTHVYISYGLLALFGLGAFFICLSHCCCERKQGHRHLFPNKNIFAISRT